MNNQNSLVPFEPAGLPAEPLEEAYWEDVEERGGGGFDLIEIKAALYRQKWLILGMLAAGLLVGALASLLIPPSYTASSTIQFQNVPQLLEAQKAVDPTIERSFNRQIKAQQTIAGSLELAETVAERLQLTNNAPFLDAVGLEVGADREAVARALTERVATNSPFESEELEISFSSADPAISAQIANAYADTLIAASIDRRYQTSSYARDFLEQKLNEARARLDTSERAALDYARRNGIVETGAAEGAAPSLSASSLVQMNTDAGAARTARIQAEQRWRQASATPVMSLPEVQSNGTIQGLIARRAQLSNELAQLRQDFRDDYPDVQRLQTQIAQIDTEVRTLAGQVRESIRDAYLTAARQESSMTSRIGGLTAQTLEDQAKRAEWERVNREAEGNRNLYNSLLQRFQEISTAAGVTTNNMAIVERATAPSKPTVPNPPLYLALAAIAGLILGTALALLREFMKDPIRSPDDVFAKLNMPLLGTTPPTSRRGPAFKELVYSNSPLSEAYHSVRASIELGRTSAPRSLLITSSRPGEGKSTTALALAADFASQGMKVLLVDADLRRPGLHKVVGGHNDAGLTNVLCGEASLQDTLQRFENLDFLASGRASRNPTEILSPGRVAEFLNRSSPLYDIIVLDGPPVVGLADAPQVAGSVEAVLFVVESGKSRRAHVQSALRRLRAVGAKIFGVVLTKFDPAAAGYGTRYGDTYSYDYGAKDDEDPRLLGAN